MPPPKPVQFGVLGTGWILRKYVEAMRLIEGSALVSVASRDLNRAQSCAREFGLPRAHGSYNDLLADPDIDVVINALHNGLHCEWTVRALQAGKHVLCEKPLGCNAAEVEQMFAAAHANQRWLMEGFMYRFHPHIVEAQRRVRAGEIGRVIHIRSARTAHGRDRANPRFWKAAGGGALLDIGCYCVNLSRMFAGEEPGRVSAQAKFDPELDVDVTLAGTLEFPGGALAQFVCSFEAEPAYAAEVIGTEGKLLIPHPWLPPFFPNEIVVTRGMKEEVVRVEDPLAPKHMLAPFALELAHLAGCVRDGKAPMLPPDTDAELDSRGNARVLDALAKSARGGQPVSPR